MLLLVNVYNIHFLFYNETADLQMQLNYNVWQRLMGTYLNRSHTLTYVRNTYSVRYASCKYAGIYVSVRFVIHRDQSLFGTCSKFISACEGIAYTLLVRLSYARYTLRHTLSTFKVSYSCVIPTLSIIIERCLIIRSIFQPIDPLLEVCMHFMNILVVSWACTYVR